MWSLAVGLGAGLGAEPPLKPGGGAQPFPRAASVREGTHPVMGGHVLPWGRVLSRGPCSHMGPTSHRGTWLTTCCHADGPLVGPRSATGPHRVTAPHTTQPCAAQPYSGTPERPIPPSPHGDSEGTTAAAPAWTAAPGDGALCPRAEGGQRGRKAPSPTLVTSRHGDKDSTRGEVTALLYHGVTRGQAAPPAQPWCDAPHTDPHPTGTEGVTARGPPLCSPRPELAAMG